MNDLLPAPSLDYQVLAPYLIMFAGAFIAIVFEALMKGRGRLLVQEVIAFLTIAATFGMLLVNWNESRFSVIGESILIYDKASSLMMSTLLFFSLLAFFLFTNHNSVEAGAQPANRALRIESEIFPMGLFSVFGMMLFLSSGNLIMLFVALEVLSLPLYVLSGLGRFRVARSQEAALKYFILGVLAAAIMLFGIVLLYAASGSMAYGEIAAQVQELGTESLFTLGLLFVIIGVLFKIGAAPFHSWVPDVYQGAPTHVTAFMAIATKLAAVATLARLMAMTIPAEEDTVWQVIIAIVAVISIAVGAIMAMVQRDIKRLIAYSSVGHAGFILTALVGATGGTFLLGGTKVTATSAVLVYLLAYGLATIGAFAIVGMVRHSDGSEATSMEDWRSIGRTHPFIGVVFTVYFLSFAGIPLTGGFIGKLAAFAVPWLAGYPWLVLVALLMSAVAAFAYVRWLTVMFFQPTDTAADRDVHVRTPNFAVSLIVIVTVILTILMGVVPGSVLTLTAQASLLM